MNVFIAFPFTDIIDQNTNTVKTESKLFLEKIMNSLLEQGHYVFLAHHREEWGKKLMTAEQCTPADLEEMKTTDIVLAFPGENPSGGVQVELGWASALKKKIYLFLHTHTNYSPLVYGLSTITEAEIIKYENLFDCSFASDLEKVLSSLI